MGVYSSNSKYINFYDIIKQKRTRHPFTIFNTDRENKASMHWCSSFFNIYPKKYLLLFDSFGFIAFKQFNVDNNLDIIDKMLFNFKIFNKKDQKITLVPLTFSIESSNKMKEKYLNELTNTAKDLFHLLSEFAKLKNNWKLC